MAESIITFNGTAEELEKFITEKKGLVVVDFFSNWCAPCKRVLGLLPKIASENPEVTFVKCSVDDNGDASAKFEVSSIPHIIFCKAEGDSFKTLATVKGADIEGIKKNIAEFK